MTNLNLNLSDEQGRFIAERVERGHYQNAQEVVIAALKALEYAEEDDEAKLIALRAALEEGEASGIAEGDPFEEALERLRSLASKQ